MTNESDIFNDLTNEPIIGKFNDHGIWEGPTRVSWSNAIKTTYGFRTDNALKFYDEEWVVYDPNRDENGYLRSYLITKMNDFKQSGQILILERDGFI